MNKKNNPDKSRGRNLKSSVSRSSGTKKTSSKSFKEGSGPRSYGKKSSDSFESKDSSESRRPLTGSRFKSEDTRSDSRSPKRFSSRDKSEFAPRSAEKGRFGDKAENKSSGKFSSFRKKSDDSFDKRSSTDSRRPASGSRFKSAENRSDSRGPKRFNPREKSEFTSKDSEKGRFSNRDEKKGDKKFSSFSKKTRDSFGKKDTSDSRKSSLTPVFKNSDKRSGTSSPKSFGKKNDDKFESKAFDRGRLTENSAKKFATKETPSKRTPRATSVDKETKKFHKDDDKSFSKTPLKTKKAPSSRSKASSKETADVNKPEELRLNRYIANAGICSRREADLHISAGLVKVNGEVVTDLGTKVMRGDDIRYNGRRLNIEEKIYVLMNKPKNTITTTEDPEGRDTVMSLLDSKLAQRVFPVGRLDRNTTGVLIFTNDGDLAQRLMHPKYDVKKIYKATLDKPITKTDLWTLGNGVQLEDGFIKPDAIAFPSPEKKNEVGLEIHSGKNRIIHRMFEHLGYIVEKLDRAAYADFVKTGLKRGEWRYMSDKEIKSLKKKMHLK